MYLIRSLYETFSDPGAIPPSPPVPLSRGAGEGVPRERRG
jgi:hypothetical protein